MDMGIPMAMGILMATVVRGYGIIGPQWIRGTTKAILRHYRNSSPPVKVLESAQELLPHHSRNVSAPLKKCFSAIKESFGAIRGSFCRLPRDHLGSSQGCFPITMAPFLHVFESVLFDLSDSLDIIPDIMF